MTRDEMIEHVGCGDVDAMGQCVTCDAIRAALRSRPAPPDDLALRHAWEAGFRLCRSYGDNHHHFDGEQKERRWRDYIKGLAAPAPVAAPAPETPAAKAIAEGRVPPGWPIDHVAPETPAPDAMPCPACEGRRAIYTRHVDGWDAQTCDACHGTGRRQEAQP